MYCAASKESLIFSLKVCGVDESGYIELFLPTKLPADVVSRMGVLRVRL